MKQLLLLLLSISITVISCASYAKKTVVQVNYAEPSTTINSMMLKPSLSTQYAYESFGVTSNQTVNKSQNFFELAVVFNEKLQQFLAFFTHLGDEVEEIVSTDNSPAEMTRSNVSPVNNGQTAIQKCKASS